MAVKCEDQREGLNVVRQNYKHGDLVYKCTYRHVSSDIVVYRLRGLEFKTIKFKRGNEFIEDIDKFLKSLGFNYVF